MSLEVRFRAASDRSLLVYLGDAIGEETHLRVIALLQAIEARRYSYLWLRNVQPAYCSLLVTFDAVAIDHDAVQSEIEAIAARTSSGAFAASRVVEIPVCYELEFGPDLAEVAAAARLTTGEVAALHTGRAYRAYFLGFAPGFAYLGDVDPALEMPRLATPRKFVQPGSVGIAGRQTAVYPFGTPGGWRLIGRTPLRMFRADREPMSLLAAGDQVRFRSISADEYRSLEES